MNITHTHMRHTVYRLGGRIKWYPIWIKWNIKIASIFSKLHNVLSSLDLPHLFQTQKALFKRPTIISTVITILSSIPVMDVILVGVVALTYWPPGVATVQLLGLGWLLTHHEENATGRYFVDKKTQRKRYLPHHHKLLVFTQVNLGHIYV